MQESTAGWGDGLLYHHRVMKNKEVRNAFKENEQVSMLLFLVDHSKNLKIRTEGSDFTK